MRIGSSSKLRPGASRSLPSASTKPSASSAASVSRASAGGPSAARTRAGSSTAVMRTVSPMVRNR